MTADLFDDGYVPAPDDHLYPWNLRADITEFAMTDEPYVIHHPACHALKDVAEYTLFGPGVVREQFEYNLEHPKDTRVSFHRCTIKRNARP